MFMCALTCFDALKEREGEREREKKKKKSFIHSFSRSMSLPYRHKEKEMKSKKKKKHYVLLSTAKRSINRSTVVYLIVVSFFSSSI
jgi:hypothetical protein